MVKQIVNLNLITFALTSVYHYAILNLINNTHLWHQSLIPSSYSTESNSITDNLCSQSGHYCKEYSPSVYRVLFTYCHRCALFWRVRHQQYPMNDKVLRERDASWIAVRNTHNICDVFTKRSDTSRNIVWSHIVKYTGGKMTMRWQWRLLFFAGSACLPLDL